MFSVLRELRSLYFLTVLDDRIWLFLRAFFADGSAHPTHPMSVLAPAILLPMVPLYTSVSPHPWSRGASVRLFRSKGELKSRLHLTAFEIHLLSSRSHRSCLCIFPFGAEHWVSSTQLGRNRHSRRSMVTDIFVTRFSVGFSVRYVYRPCWCPRGFHHQLSYGLLFC